MPVRNTGLGHGVSRGHRKAGGMNACAQWLSCCAVSLSEKASEGQPVPVVKPLRARG